MSEQIFGGVPSGYEAFVLAESAKKQSVIYVASTEKKALRTYDILKLISPQTDTLFYPAWDTGGRECQKRRYS